MGRDGNQTWSRWLRRYRDGRDMTQEELGEILGVDGKMVSAWENGRRPARKHTRNICARLHTTRVELGLVEPEEAAPLVGRRDFLRRSASWGALAIFGPWAGLDAVDAHAADAFEATTRMLTQHWLRAGATAALGPTLGHVESVTRLLQGSVPGSLRPRLCRVLAESSILAAVCKSWIGDQAGADHLSEIAFEAAQEGRDPDLGIRVLLIHTSGDRHLQDRPEVKLRRYEQGDHGFAVADAGPATRAWARAKAADVHASMGQAEACLEALDDAAALLAGAHGHTSYPWPDEPWLSGERGASLARLGRTAEARQALTAALAAAGPDRAVDRLWLLIATARTHLHDGEPEVAARIALEVLQAARRARNGLLADEVARLHLQMPVSAAPAIRSLEQAHSIS